MFIYQNKWEEIVWLEATVIFLTKSFKAAHSDTENHSISLENKCPTAEDNGPICMVMGMFGRVSEELDKTEMGCHGLVIVLGKAYNCFTWKDEQGTLKDKRDLSENINYCIKQGCETCTFNMQLCYYTFIFFIMTPVFLKDYTKFKKANFNS